MIGGNELRVEEAYDAILLLASDKFVFPRSAQWNQGFGLIQAADLFRSRFPYLPESSLIERHPAFEDGECPTNETLCALMLQRHVRLRRLGICLPERIPANPQAYSADAMSEIGAPTP